MISIFKKSKYDYLLFFIYLHIFIMPWNFANGIMGTSTLVLSVLTLITYGFKVPYQRIKAYLKFKPLLLMLLFLSFSYASILWSSDFERAVNHQNFFKYYIFTIPIFLTIFNAKQAKCALYVFLTSIFLYTLFSFTLYLEIYHVHYTIDHKYFAISSSAEPRGLLASSLSTLYAAISILFFSVLFFKITNIKKKIALFSILFIMFFVLLVNNGRGAQLAFLATSFLLLIILSKQYLKFKPFIISMLVFITLIYISTHFINQKRYLTDFNNLKTAIETQNFRGSWGHRAYLWFAAAEIIPQAPIFGHGAGGQVAKLITFTNSHPGKSSYLRTFHNQHLSFLTQYGLIGFILFWSSVIMLVQTLKKNKLYFYFSFIFFTLTFFASFADIIILIKPFNNIFITLFMLFVIIAFKETQASPKVTNVI